MLPQELRDTPQWLVSSEDKAPRSPKTGRHADVRDRSLYGTFDEAVAFASEHGMDVGFALTPEDPFVVIDLDSTENPEDQERQRKIYEAFPTYAELSRSGRGVHIWCKGSLPRGARRDAVEVYPHSRYMICTGKSLREVAVVDCQEMLDILFHEISGNGTGELSELEEHESLLSDQDVFDMAMRADNADKFDMLARGDWENSYPSQSEADYALMNILAFYSKSNEQCKRLFRYSALGHRAKAQREAYLDGMLRKIRAEEAPPIDFSMPFRTAGVMANPETDYQKEKVPESVPFTPSLPPDGKKKPPDSNATGGEISWPPGLIGEIAQYITNSSTRPVREVGIWAALGLMAGIVGRQFNISGTGLNQYLILLAKTGVGKEGGAQGIERILAAVRDRVPYIDEVFVGPGTFASGQAIIRTLDDQPCFFSILGEFGLTLQDLSDQNANSLSRVMRRVLLDLYTKSGHTSVLYSSAYSDREKNTKTLFAPAMTLMGESTPDAFYAGLSLHHIADGLIPRFLIIEYTGDRPNRNRNAFYDPPTELLDKFCNRVEIVMQMLNNKTFQEVALDDEARAVLTQFDVDCDAHIRGGGNEGIRQLWNRAHLKALRLAALIAVADRPHSPIVNRYEAEYAVWLVGKDVQGLAERFESGDVGLGDSKQIADIQRILKEYLDRDDIVESYRLHPTLRPHRVVQRRYIQRRVAGLSAFRNDRRGAVRAMDDTVNALEKSGYLEQVPRKQLQAAPFNFNSNESCWFIREL